MKKIMLIAIQIIVTVLISAYTIGQAMERETRSISGFKEVNFGVSGNLYVKIGDDFQVVIETNRKFLAAIITEVRDGRLIVRKNNYGLFNNEKVNVYITMPEIKGLAVSGSGKAQIEDVVKNENLDLSVSGSGKILAADINTGNLKCRISGSGNIVPEGNREVSKGDIFISGSGNFLGEGIKIENLKVAISGSGNCKCNVSESLEAIVSGSGNVNYTGNPRINARVSGSGHVRSK